MKTIAEQVKQFRTAPNRRWNTTELAHRCGTSRQNIENLEDGKVALPGYIVALADVMETSVDTLLGRKPATNVVAMEPPALYRALPPLAAALETLGTALSQVPIERCTAVADNLAGWARERGAEHYKDLLLLLLQSPSRKAQVPSA